MLRRRVGLVNAARLFQKNMVIVPLFYLLNVKYPAVLPFGTNKNPVESQYGALRGFMRLISLFARFAPEQAGVRVVSLV